MLNNLLSTGIGEMFANLWRESGLANGDWSNYVMILVSFVLFYLAIVKKFEPLLLLPIAFGMFLINLPGAYDVLWGTYEDVAITSEEFIASGMQLPEGWHFLDGNEPSSGRGAVRERSQCSKWHLCILAHKPQTLHLPLPSESEDLR